MIMKNLVWTAGLLDHYTEYCIWTKLSYNIVNPTTYHFNGITAQPLEHNTAPMCEKPALRCQIMDIKLMINMKVFCKNNDIHSENS